MPFPDYSLINDAILEAINRYVIQHEPAGHFVMAVLKNDLHEAFSRADENNSQHMFHVVSYCHNEIPGGCWGSPMEVAKWLEIPKEQWASRGGMCTVPENPKEMLRQIAMGIWNSHYWKNEVREHARTHPD